MTNVALFSRHTIRACALLLMIGLGGCATSSDAKRAVTKFASATESATAAIKEYDQAAATRVTTTRREVAVANPKGVTVLGEDCSTSSQRCRVLYRTTQAATPVPLTVKTLIPEHVKAASAISAYAAALQEVVDANAQDEVGAALDKASVTIRSLANIVAPGAQPRAQAITGPTANLLAWAYGKYEENLKLDALRAATQKMNQTMQGAADKFGKIASLAELVGKAESAQAFEDARKTFDDRPSKGSIDALVAVGDKFDLELQAPAQAVFSNIANAHGKLTKALVEGPDSLAEIYDALEQLAKDAETLHGIAQDFKKAAASQ